MTTTARFTFSDHDRYEIALIKQGTPGISLEDAQGPDGDVEVAPPQPGCPTGGTVRA
jgi:hypothetical protein